MAILNTNIVIKSIEDTGTQIKIKDENKHTWSFFKNKQDGSPTVAFGQWPEYQIGEQVGVGYKEVPYKDTMLKNIVNFTPVMAKEHTKPQIPTTFAKENNYIPPKPEKQDDFWEKKAYKQCLWNYWLVTDRQNLLTPGEMNLIYDVFKQIEADAETKFIPF